jgi:hypothetical protein
MIITIPVSPDMSPIKNIFAVIEYTEGVSQHVCSAGVAGRDLAGIDRIRNICEARNACLEKISTHDFGVMNDADCYHLHADNLRVMRDRLNSDPDLVCVALLKQGEGGDPNHIACGCMMFSKSFFDLGIQFEAVENECECKTFTKKIKAAGKKIEYVDTKIRITDTHQNTFN